MSMHRAGSVAETSSLQMTAERNIPLQTFVHYHSATYVEESRILAVKINIRDMSLVVLLGLIASLYN